MEGASTQLLASPTGLIFDAVSTDAFAVVSGDHNPLHVDSVSARRYIFGSTVAHGIHILLRALEHWADAVIPGQRWQLRSLDVHFDRPIRIGSKATLQIKPSENDHHHLTVTVENQIAVRLRFNWCALNAVEKEIDYLRCVPDKGSCRIAEIHDIESESGQIPLYLDISSISELIPGLAARFSLRQLSRLLATTRLVGMICPGLNSIYSRLRIEFESEPQCDSHLQYEVTHLDSRFSSAKLRIKSGELAGDLFTFFRPEPCQQPSITELKTMVGPTEFSGQVALVIGGSRGLGEVTAKLLTAGGARILLTFSTGEDDASRIVEEIQTEGGAAKSIQWDARASKGEAKIFREIEGDIPTHLYYFATPRITTGSHTLFSKELFSSYCEFYVNAFSLLMQELPDLSGLFYPSSVFVDDTPNNMAEYSAAKAAGENLCQFYKKTRPSLIVLSPRLPRMATDQTLSLMGTPEPRPEHFLLPLLRQLHRETTTEQGNEKKHDRPPQT